MYDWSPSPLEKESYRKISQTLIIFTVACIIEYCNLLIYVIKIFSIILNFYWFYFRLLFFQFRDVFFGSLLILSLRQLYFLSHLISCFFFFMKLFTYKSIQILLERYFDFQKYEWLSLTFLRLEHSLWTRTYTHSAPSLSLLNTPGGS